MCPPGLCGPFHLDFLVLRFPLWGWGPPRMGHCSYARFLGSPVLSWALLGLSGAVWRPTSPSSSFHLFTLLFSSCGVGSLEETKVVSSMALLGLSRVFPGLSWGSPGSGLSWVPWVSPMFSWGSPGAFLGSPGALLGSVISIQKT